MIIVERRKKILKFFKIYKFAFTIVFIFSIESFAIQNELHFEHITTNEGLSKSSVTCIVRDMEGFIWIGTFNGLNRYDGFEFRVYQYNQNDSSSISDNYISSILEDHKGRLWVGTDDGLNCYNRKMDNFIHFRHNPNIANSINDNQIEVIFEDSKERLWIGTRNGGLNLYNEKDNTFIHYVHDGKNSESISSNFIQSIFEDKNGNLWIGHRNGAIDILYKNQKKFSHFLPFGNNLTNSAITAIVESKNKDIWIGTQGDGIFRLCSINSGAPKITHYISNSKDKTSLSGNIILSLMVDKEDKLWIGTEDEGLNILDITKNKITFYKNDPFNNFSLNNNSIYKIYEDIVGNIWIGTYAGGINLIAANKNYFHYYKHIEGEDNSLSNNIINSFCENNDRNIWIATGGGGLDLFDRKKRTFVHYNSKNSSLKANVILSLYNDKYGNLWIGTWANGLFEFNKKTKRFLHFTKEKNGLGSNNIFQILEGNDGNLWLCTFWGGLTNFDVKNQSSVVYNTKNSSLIDNDVRTITKDYNGNLWIGTDVSLEFFNLQTKIFKSYKHNDNNKHSLSKGFVNYILQSKDSTLWIGTSDGLNRFDVKTNSFIHYSENNGLPNNEIMCIVEDKDGDLWLSTGKGISRFDPKLGNFKNYDISDGLQGNEFNAGSGFRTKDGEILFGGNRGFNIFQPKNLKDNPFIPPVFITGLKIFNKPVSIGGKNSPLIENIVETKKLDFSYYQSVISFTFVALNYISPEKNKYAYMMEGFDKDWNYIGSNHTATYTNLDPGHYIFRVKAANNDGIWNEKGASINIIIEPPFWKTWWAYLIESLLLILIVYMILNYFISRQRLRNTIKMEHMELEKMYELDQMKSIFFSNISHELNSPMTLIISVVEKLVKLPFVEEKIKNGLISIQHNVNRLRRMTKQLKDFNKLETGDLKLYLSKGDIFYFIKEIFYSFYEYAKDHHIAFHFEANKPQQIAWFDPDKLDKIIYNLLSNAFKFTPEGGEVNVEASVINCVDGIDKQNKSYQYIEIKVKDSGIGIPKDKLEFIFKREYHLENYNGLYFDSSGIGLSFVNELIKIYKGEITVDSIEGKGSTFTVRIPIDENYLEENQLVHSFKIPSNNNLNTLNYIVAQGVNNSDIKKNKNKYGDMPVVLFVEDDKEIRDYMKDYFSISYRVHEARDGIIGLEKAFKFIPDIIIMDIKMPKMDGIELCKRIKNNEKTSHIPIIMLTGYLSEEYKITGLSQGADVYLTKPFSIDVLEAYMNNLLDARKKLREKYAREMVLGPSKVPVTNIEENFLRHLTEIVEKHISDTKFNADILSKEINMSKMQLYRKLRSLTEQTVHEFIRDIRLKRAVQLLEQKRMTITEVAYEVGFNDLTYFARCFRKKYEKSPSEYISKKN